MGASAHMDMDMQAMFTARHRTGSQRSRQPSLDNPHKTPRGAVRNGARDVEVSQVMDIAELRAMKDEYFARGGDSPLTDAQRTRFTGLHYYDPDPAFRFEADLDRPTMSEYEDIQTSDGQVQHLPRAGTLRFRIGEQDVALAAYDQGHELFIPFRDATSGGETYGSGRYVEAHPLSRDRYEIDFNTAYNPYCAYNENWSCPLPPRENWLDISIRAGEKSFH